MSKQKSPEIPDPAPESELTDRPKETEETHDLLLMQDQKEKLEAEEADLEQELAQEEIFETKHSDGHTLNPHHAAEQGLTYTPPTDPPTLPSEDPQGAKVGAGFAPSMEDAAPDAEVVPDRIKQNDLDLLEKVDQLLQNNSETAHLTNIKVQVDNGVVNLLGTVPSQDDIGRVHDILADLDGVVGLKNNLQVNP